MRPVPIQSEFFTKIMTSEVIDPFADSPETEVFRAWLLSNEEEFKSYNEELKYYQNKVLDETGYLETPEWMYKSADKFILRAMELFTEKFDKPATVFLSILRELVKKVSSPFTDVIHSRMEDTFSLIEKLKAGDKKVVPELKERGFV